MKLFGFFLAHAGQTYAKTDVQFNLNHERLEIAHLEMWNALANKFFQMHEADLRPKFFQNWAGNNQNGRFAREIKKLEQNFIRKCSSKDLVPRQDGTDLPNPDAEYIYTPASAERTRRADSQLKQVHNPGHRMKHIVHNVKKWTEDYLTGCSNQQKVVNRWQRFINKWENEIAKNPIFQEEFKQEEKYLRKFDGPGGPCGIIFQEFGLHGQSMELQDASRDEENGFNDLSKTDFGSFQLMSMQPYEGCYIRAYAFNDKRGYSSICSDPSGCPITPSYQNGPLTPNTASSVYCYCNAPKPKICARIFQNDDADKFKTGQAAIFDGIKLGYYDISLAFGMHFNDMNFPPYYVRENELSAIQAYAGCQVDIWSGGAEQGDHFKCSGYENAEHFCGHDSLGRVKNDGASSIKCTCPVDFESIEYDTPKSDWDLVEDHSTSTTLHEQEVSNSCNPAFTSCGDQTYQWTESVTLKSQHNWGEIFKFGVSYSATAKAELGGIGGESTVTFSADVTESTGGFHETDQTVSSSTTCTAKPLTRVNCKFIAYKTTIEIGYTIHWKNATPTRGVYKGEGWKSQLIAIAHNL